MIDKVKIAVALLIIIAAVGAYYHYSDLLQVGRVSIVIAGVLVGASLVLNTESGQTAWAFIKGANIERQKVVWPTRQEALQVTLLVIIMVIILGLVMWGFDALSFYTIYDLILRVRS